MALGQAIALLNEAEASAGVEVSRTLADEIDMSLYVDDSNPERRALWLLYRVPPRGNRQLEDDVQTVLSGLFFEDDEHVDWYRNDHPARPAGLARDERVMRWQG